MIGTGRPLVLLGFAEAFAAIEAIWSLQSAGMDVIAFTRRGSRSAIRRIKGVTVVEIDAPEKDLAATIAELSLAVATMEPDAFLPLDDASLWLSRQIDLGRQRELSDTMVVGPDLAGVDLALDKAAQIDAALEAGLDVPGSVVFRGVGEVRVDRWPVILKPSDAVRVVGNTLIRPTGRICATEEELLAAKAELRPGPIVRQTLVRGVGEGLFGFVGPNGTVDLTAHRRVRMLNPHGSASSACRSIDVDPELATRVVDLLERANWRGLFMAEFLRDDKGTAWFMELNGRAWGSLALARLRGYEYPAWAVQSALELPKSPAPPETAPHLVARHLGREIGHLAFVLRGPQTDAAVTWPSRWGTIRDLVTVRKEHRLYNWSARQPGVLATDTWRTLADLAASRRRNA
jgi:hypothetical protein